MAEFDGESASLGLFQEFFSHLSTQDESADGVGRSSSSTGGGSTTSGDAVGGTAVLKYGYGSVNNVDDRNTKQHSFSKSFLQSSVLPGKHENGVSTTVEEDTTTDDKMTGLVVEDSYDDSSSDEVRQNNVAGHDVNKRTLADSENRVVAEDEQHTADSDSDEDDGNAHRHLANGTVSPGQTSYDRKKKGVNFPKDTVISGYLDPPDPWKTVSSWTTSELVTAYRKSCEINGAKPIAKLIQQLETFNPANKREEVLNLKGEKLDQKQCECIEEILKRVRFKLLDLEACHLDDETAVALFDMIEFYESSYQLNIAFNRNIQARGWQACSRLVRRTPELTCLDLRSCDLNEHTIPIFGRALKLGCHLTILHMENMNLSGRALIILVVALKMNDTLQELFLADNKLLPTDGIQLGNLLRYNHKLTLLDLRNNHLQDVGVGHLCDGLMEQPKGSGIRTLVLWNNSINYQAMSVIGTALASSQNIETLNIGHNSITNEGVHLLKDGLLRVSSLLRLGLQGTRISDEGAVALAEYIAESMVLLRIDLRDNDIKTGGLMALSHAMRVNTSVTRIDLDKEPKKESGIRDYIEQQRRLLKDIQTFQDRNIQIALQKEEEERTRLQKKAKDELAAAQKEADAEKQSGTLPDNFSTESFTVIDELPSENEQVEKEKELAENTETVAIEEENCVEDISHEKLDDVDEIDSMQRAVDGKLQQRPNVLFPAHLLPPQTTLDSPLPIFGHSDSTLIAANSMVQSELGPEEIIPAALGSSAPAEIILSPQYFPKQIARKIFSVSRVTEDTTSQQMPSYPASLSFDPLCVSPLTLIPVPPLPTVVPFAMPVLQGTERVSQHSKLTLQTANTSALLLQQLAEETMKHLVSPDVEIDATSLFRTDSGTNLQTELDSTTDNAGLSKDLLVYNSPSSSILKSSDTESLLQAATSTFESTVQNNDVNICDNIEFLVSNAKELANLSSADSDNSGNLVVTDVSAAGRDGVASEHVDSEEGIFTLERTSSEDIPNLSTGLSTSSERGLGACANGAHDSAVGDMEAKTKKDHGVFHATAESVFNSHTDVGLQEQYSLQTQDLSGHLSSSSSTGESHVTKSSVTLNNVTGNNVTLNSVTLSDKNNRSSDQTGLQHHHDGPGTNSPSLPHSNQKHASSLLTDTHTQEESMAFHLISLNNPSLHSPESIEELLFPTVTNPYVRVQSTISESEETSKSSCLRSQSPEVGNKDGHLYSQLLSAQVLSDQQKNDPLDDQVNVNNMTSDNTDIDNIDIDEEPWLTVGVDVEGHDIEPLGKSSKQPDFFTTLTMNGLAQELASALTSFDGPTGPYEVEDYNIGS